MSNPPLWIKGDGSNGTPPQNARLYLAKRDSVEWLSTFASESVDLLITDPAYESLEKYRKVGTTTRLKVSDGSSNEWFPIFKNERFPSFFDQAYRVLKRNAHLYVYCDQETAFVIKPMGEKAGFKFWKPLIWDKVSMGMGYHYRCQYEMILFFEKGKRKLNDLSICDVLACNRIKSAEKYPTEKPVSISSTLIHQSSISGDLVVDPFMGSGSVGEASLILGRRFAGCDISEKALDVATKRLQPIVFGNT